MAEKINAFSRVPRSSQHGKLVSETTSHHSEVNKQEGTKTVTTTTVSVYEEEIEVETDDSEDEYETTSTSYVLARFPCYDNFNGVGFEKLFQSGSTGLPPLIRFTGMKESTPICTVYNEGEETPCMIFKGQWGTLDHARLEAGETDLCVISYEEREAPIKTGTSCRQSAVSEVLPSLKEHVDEDFLLVARRAADKERRRTRKSSGGGGGEDEEENNKNEDFEKGQDVGRDSRIKEWMNLYPISAVLEMERVMI